MKVNVPVLDDLLSPLLLSFKKDNFTHSEIDKNPPLRSELFSKEQMAHHARSLATHHTPRENPAPEFLLKALAENEEILKEVNEILTRSVSEKKSITPAAEWLIDNFFLIEEQITLGKRYLPKGYSKELPRIQSGLPRVYDLAIEIISHSDGHVDNTNLTAFIEAYQSERNLSLGELWAIPIMLRLALIENLSRVAAMTAVDRKDSIIANRWANQIIECIENSPKELVLVVADMARSHPPMVSAFVAEFARKLQWKGPERSLALNWIELLLAETGNTIAGMVLTENQNQAADQVSVSNSINSLRFLAKMDWREFVETQSVVERILQTDKNGIYGRMDFFTRDVYRHTVERLARLKKCTEEEIATLAISLAREAAISHPGDTRRSHVGYYLSGKGLEETERAAKVRLPYTKVIARLSHHFAPYLYFPSVILLTTSLTLAGVWQLDQSGTGTALLFLIGGILTICSSQLALILTNWLATQLVSPKPLPRLDFSKGIPAEFKTLVVVPTLLTNASQIDKLIEELEVRFLSNRGPNLLFGLLTDLVDAPSESMEGDAQLVQLAQEQIQQLNRKYGRALPDTFFLFHRPRHFNREEKIWMGFERKRGKLNDLNQLIIGKSSKAFSVIVGDQATYASVTYIITLDTDTQLPRDSAWKLVGMMAHPMNKPVYDEKKKIVTDGYTIIQPRIAISLHGATRSLYTRLHESDAGIDPYTRTISDVYQDVFSEGSFIGKGIYDVRMFDRVLHNRLPENRILSHDLLEGCYARSSFASDVQLYEEYPSRYDIDVRRRSRWIRGDWQIASWFLPIAPNHEKRLQRNALSGLSRWKIFDNLRRSLFSTALLLLFIAGWTVIPYPILWTLFGLTIIFAPAILNSILTIVAKPPEVELKQHLSNAARLNAVAFIHGVFNLFCLPYEAFISMYAIVITFYRVHISGTMLLQWNPSSTQRRHSLSIQRSYIDQWFPVFISLALLTYLVLFNPEVLYLAVPFIILWVIAPALVYRTGTPAVSSKSRITKEESLYLRELARKTWMFFEEMVTLQNNWLPPDNLQVYPARVIAHRTSPTNIGLSLLANLAALDFGYIPQSEFIQKTSNTFSTLDQMERYRGHFYNWYETTTLDVLQPRYISTVDSGNLAGHLLTLRQGLLELPQQPVIKPEVFSGLEDTLRLAMDEIPADELIALQVARRLYADLRPSNNTLPTLRVHLISLTERIQALIVLLSQPTRPPLVWLLHFEQQVAVHLRSFNQLVPWMNGSIIPATFLDLSVLKNIPTLQGLTEMEGLLREELSLRARPEGISGEEEAYLSDLYRHVEVASGRASAQLRSIQNLVFQCSLFSNMQYDFLYDATQHLLSIGYTVDDHQRDRGYYDLLASEARLGIFVAIAQGKIPQESWFTLGRRLTTVGNTPVLLSWSGSMFEYLMPNLVMPVYENTLLDEMGKGALKKQIAHGAIHHIPWGISESCYNFIDAHSTYQYRAFGIPGLGFKRGLGQDLVIAPYATVLALMVDPRAAFQNLKTMQQRGYEGTYGFYEAIDFTAERLAHGQSAALIQTYMAHHQGMSLLSIAYLVLDQPMQKRFEADIQLQTALLLLQERVPKSTGSFKAPDIEKIMPIIRAAETRVLNTPYSTIPEVQLLSNSRYSVMITNSGGGYSRWKDLAVTRWREDSTRDHWGQFLYLYDRTSGQLWSATHQPTLKDTISYQAIFTQGRAEFRRTDFQIESYTTIIVSPEDDVEVRRIQITNHSSEKRKLSLSSYGEVVLNSPAADDAHPAFSNLFVQTEIREQQNAIVSTRRARSAGEHPPWMFHLMKVNGVQVDGISYETDRSKFIGRNFSLAEPQALIEHGTLSGSQGSVLDPIFAIQYKIAIDSGETAVIDIVTGIADTPDVNQSLIDKYQDKHLRDRAFELAWTHSQVVLRQIGATNANAQTYSRLAGSILYLNPSLRAPQNILRQNQRGQASLWSYSISGDLPIVLLYISDLEFIALVKQLLKAQVYWQMNGLITDLVIINQDTSIYRQQLQDLVQGLITSSHTQTNTEKRGHTFLRSIDQISTEDHILLQTVAHVILSDTKSSLDDQLNKRTARRVFSPRFVATRQHIPSEQKKVKTDELLFFNEIGGFSPDGREYIITTGQTQKSPLPWVNVLANPEFGSVVSENGSSYTWFQNAHEYRLTPWSNDPVMDVGGEAFYIRDEESGRYWSPLGFPTQGDTPYTTHHGFGYTEIEHMEDGLKTTTTIHVDAEAPVKFIQIRVINRSGRTRKVTVTGYCEWVLADLRSKSLLHLVTDLDTTTGALLTRNNFNSEFLNYVSFFEVDQENFTFTTDRTEFLGRNGTLAQPDAMRRLYLSGKSSAGTDPCTALRVERELSSGEEYTVVFKLGAAKDTAEALETILKFKQPASSLSSRKIIQDFWRKTLGSIRVETPDQALNLLANGWLQYQVISSRLWARSGFYQSGGAFGFRDQLQDVMALFDALPNLARTQILLCASRQFKEGDVQHWWHPPKGRGVRTRCSDDYLWLPYVTSRYISCTNDVQILEEQMPYLQGRALNTGEESHYDLHTTSDMQGTLFEHCKRAILHGLRFGEHGLPLHGSGDWNDGMNQVGIEGKGESVWLAFFLYDVLTRFIPVALHQGDQLFARKCEFEAAKLKENIHAHTWDDRWYLRAFFDDGSKLGSHQNSECKIDAISQSWSVLSNGGNTERAHLAMKSVDSLLVNREKDIIQLLDPPFDKSDVNPGYIKGYVPGVRENGGQYTHAAIWVVMAFAKMGDKKATEELLRLINPIYHGSTLAETSIYKAEPYVMAADVYGISPHIGRGGWSWYTGSAGWMYQLIMEYFLGLQRTDQTLSLKPCIPASWSYFSVNYIYKETKYSIRVVQQPNLDSPFVMFDGIRIEGTSFELRDDRTPHQVTVTISS